MKYVYSKKWCIYIWPYIYMCTCQTYLEFCKCRRRYHVVHHIYYPVVYRGSRCLNSTIPWSFYICMCLQQVCLVMQNTKIFNLHESYKDQYHKNAPHRSKFLHGKWWFQKAAVTPTCTQYTAHMFYTFYICLESRICVYLSIYLSIYLSTYLSI